MRITDKEIIQIFQEYGTLSASQLVPIVFERYGNERTDHSIRAMIYSLARYKILRTTEKINGTPYYYLDGTDPRPIYDAPIMERITDFLTANAPDYFTADTIAENIRANPKYTARILRRMAGISRHIRNNTRYYGVASA